MCSYPISGLLSLFVIILVFCKKKKKSKQITLVTNELSLIVVRHDKNYVSFHRSHVSQTVNNILFVYTFSVFKINQDMFLFSYLDTLILKIYMYIHIHVY